MTRKPAKKSYLRTGATEFHNTIDKQTSEVLDAEVKQHKYLVNTKEEFFFCYSAIVGVFERMTQAEIRIFGYCLRYARGVKFDISKKIRVSMAQETNLNERTIYNALPSLIEKGLFFKYPDGLYVVNPRYVFQGSTAERNYALSVLLELHCPHC